MMLQLEQSADEYVVCAGDLRLTFRFVRDRWRHELALRVESGWRTLLTSIEGSPEETVPPSPPFQDLRLETFGDDTREFQLLGQAGRGAYSAAVRLEGETQTVTFDVAARAVREGAAICTRSMYEVPADPEIVRGLEPGGLLLPGSGGEGLMFTAPAALLCPQGPDAGRLGLRNIATGPFVEGPSASRNVRWQYRIRRFAVP